MGAETGLYAIVRFVEDLERREPKNVGVLLASSAGLVPRFVERDDLGPQNEVVQRLIRDLRRDEDDPFTILRDLSSRRFAHFEIDEPLATVVDDEPEALLDRLASRLVVPAAHRLLHS